MARPVTVQVGPLAAASTSKIAAVQKLAATGGGYVVMNGAAGTATANNIATTQTPAGAGAITLNGTTVSGGVAYLGTPQRVYVTTVSDETAKTAVVTGTMYNATGPGIYIVTETITLANASVTSTSNLYWTVTSIVVSAATTGAITAGAYGAATLDTARRILWTSSGSDAGITATIIGNNASSYPQTEVLTGGAATATSKLDFLTVSSILLSGAAAANVSFGTNGVASSPWAQFDEYSAMGPTAIQVDGSGTVNWTVQQTLNDPNSATDPVLPYNVDWVSHPDSALVASTTTTGVQGNYAYPPKWARITMNSNGGTTAYAKATFIQNYQK